MHSIVVVVREKRFCSATEAEQVRNGIEMNAIMLQKCINIVQYHDGVDGLSGLENMRRTNV